MRNGKSNRYTKTTTRARKKILWRSEVNVANSANVYYQQRECIFLHIGHAYKLLLQPVSCLASTDRVLFLQIGSGAWILMEEFTTLIMSIGRLLGTDLGQVRLSFTAVFSLLVWHSLCQWSSHESWQQNVPKPAIMS